MDTPLQPGMVVNSRYRIVRSIGSGAFGEVYLGKDLKLKGSLWALKEVMGIGPGYADRKEFLESFHNEAGILMTLDHAGIPRVVDYFISGGRGYLVMERIEGLTLEEIALNNKKPLDEKEVLTWALQICETLKYLHSHEPPIIFRDLKPSNIMLTIEERVVLIDFGIARVYSPEKSHDTVALGTPGYSPPEQYGKSQTTPASDLYSLGTTMFFLLTQADMAHFNFRFPPVREKNPEVSPQLERVLVKCLDLTPRERYQEAKELAGELQNILQGVSKGLGMLKKYGRILDSIKLDSVLRSRKQI